MLPDLSNSFNKMKNDAQSYKKYGPNDDTYP